MTKSTGGFRRLFSSFLVLFGGASVMRATTLAPLPIEDVLTMKSPGPWRQFSPDGKWLAYTIRTRQTLKPPGGDDAYVGTGVPWNGAGADVVITDIQTHKTYNVTRNGDNWLPSWSPDGRYLAFLSDGDGSGQAKLWVWRVEDHRCQRVSDLALRANQITWTPDSHKVLVTALPEGLSPSDYARRFRFGEQMAASVQADSPGATMRAYESPASLDPWNLDYHLRDLVLLDIASGRVEALTHHRRISSFDIFPDGSRVAFSSAQRFEQAGSQQVIYDLVIVTLSTKAQRTVASALRLDLAGRFSISPTGSELSYRANGTTQSAFDLYVVGANDGMPRILSGYKTSPSSDTVSSSPGWHYSSVPIWDKEGTNLYFVSGGDLWKTSVNQGITSQVASIEGRQIVQLIFQPDDQLWTLGSGNSTVAIARDEESKQEGFYRIDLTNGKSTKLLERRECYTCLRSVEGEYAVAIKGGQTIAYVAQDAQHAPDIWLTDADFGRPSPLTHLNPRFDSYEMGTPQVIEWLDDDGKRLHGGLLLPSDYRPGKRCPLIVLVYGGLPLSNEINGFGGFERESRYFNIQLLATRGYAVLQPDAPQSLGVPMLDLAKTVLPGVNKVVEMGVADPGRVGVMGHSYGGYSTLSLIVQTSRFKAAIEASGMGDLVGSYGQMDRDGTAFGVSLAELGQELMGGTPWEFRDRYIENSPIFYLNRVETPLLIVHGSDDSAVPSFLGDEVFVGLRRLGKVAEYVKYEQEGHVLYGHADRVDLCQRMLAWFDLYLKGETSRR